MLLAKPKTVLKFFVNTTKPMTKFKVMPLATPNTGLKFFVNTT